MHYCREPRPVYCRVFANYVPVPAVRQEKPLSRTRSGLYSSCIFVSCLLQLLHHSRTFPCCQGCTGTILRLTSGRCKRHGAPQAGIRAPHSGTHQREGIHRQAAIVSCSSGQHCLPSPRQRQCHPLGGVACFCQKLYMLTRSIGNSSHQMFPTPLTATPHPMHREPSPSCAPEARQLTCSPRSQHIPKLQET